MSVGVALSSCGSSHGPEEPYGLREVETAFREHHVDTGRFGDLTAGRLREPFSKETFKRGVAVVVTVDDAIAKPGERARVRAALADLD